MQASIVLLLAIGSSAVLASEGYGAAQPQQAYPSQQQVYYKPVFQPAQYALPNYDVNYCTVQASFPLVDRNKNDRKNHHHRDRRQAYGSVQQPASYQPSAPYGAYPQPFDAPFTRRFDRQLCRHTAIFSQTACDICCKLSSRSSGSNNAAVTGALFVFDPKIKDDRRDSYESEEENKEEDKEDKRVLQCACCMPRSV